LAFVLFFCLFAIGADASATRSYAYDLSGRLWRAMDAQGTLLSYTYDAVGNITQIKRDQVDPSFNILGTLPLTGGAGDLVTVQGNGFDQSLVGNQVQIGGVDATVVSVDSNGRKLVVRVPWGAESGPLTVTVGDKTITAPDDFTIVHYGDVGIHGTLVGANAASFPVELKAGQTILVRVADTAKGALSPKVVLNDASEAQEAMATGAVVAGFIYTATAGGSFQIVVSDTQKVGGEFVLYYTVAPGSNEGGALDPNEPTDGVIDLGDLDSFTFEATVGKPVRLSLSNVGGGALTPYLMVFDPNGTQVGQISSASVAVLALSPTVAGKYTVVVSGNAATGTYKLYYMVAPGSNDGGALHPDEPSSGAIDVGDQDAYTFDATAGRPVRVSVADTGATTLYPYVIVYDPNGTLVGQAGNYNVAAYGFTPTASGKYTVLVIDASSGNDATGAYQIYFSQMPGSSDGGALDRDNPVSGVIDLGDQDVYTIDVTAGHPIRVSVADTALTAMYPYLLVYDPNGTLVGQAGNYTVAAYGFNPTASGKYSVLVLDASTGNDATGAYQIYMSEMPGSKDGGALDADNPVSAVSDLGDQDVYTIDATAGHPVRVSVADTGATALYPHVIVYDPNGTLVGQAGNYTVAAYGFNPSVSGKYSVLVVDGSTGNDATGAYQIYMSEMPGSKDGGALDPNNPVSAVIDLGDQDVYTLDATAGQPVRLSVADTGLTAMYPYLIVYDPNGKLVGQVGNYTVAAYGFTPALSGKYSVLVVDASTGNDATGAYQIYCSQMPGSNDGGTLDPNNPVSGVIDLGDQDAYTFDVTASHAVRLALSDVSQTGLYPYLIVYDPNGALVAQGGNHTVAEVAFTPAVSGKYTALVVDASTGNDTTGAYLLYYTVAPGSTDGGQLDANNPLDGLIEQGDVDAYTFDTAAGHHVRLQAVDVNQTGLYPYLFVYDQNGSLVAQGGGNDVAVADFIAASSGTFTVTMLDASTGNAATGPYKIYYAEAPGSSEGALDPVNPLDGTIDEGDIDGYTFDVTAGQSVQLRLADALQGTFYPYFFVYDPTGKLVGQAGNLTVAAYSFTAALTGKYTALLMDGSSGNAGSGSYKLYSAIAPGSNEGGLLTVGTAATGTIDLGDVDSFTFNASAGAKFQLVATDVLTTAFLPALVVYGPTGASVVTGSGASAASVTFTAATAGTYTAVVYDASSGYASNGDYSLLLTQN
jgi:YD repeat-containing protein